MTTFTVQKLTDMVSKKVFRAFPPDPTEPTNTWWLQD